MGLENASTFLEAEGLEPSQSYLCAADLQSVELSSAQRFRISNNYTVIKHTVQDQILASHLRLELRLMVLETIVLPLH